MDKFGIKLIELLRSGADPRRADHGRKRHVEVSAAAHVTALTATGTRNLRAGLVIGMPLGMIVAVLLVGIVFAAMGLWPARLGDIDMARRLRAVLPHPERLSENDLAQRLSVPQEVGRLVAPLIDLDRSFVSRQASTYASLEGQVGLFVDPGRMETLSQLASRLGPLSRRERADRLDSLLELDRALHEPAAAAILQGIMAVPADDLGALARVQDLPRLLIEIADLTPAKQRILRGTTLSSVLPDGERADLLHMLPTLDPPAVHLLVRWSNVDALQRQLLIYVLGEIEGPDPSFVRLVTAFYMRNPIVMRTLGALNPRCGFASAEACR